jgi:hypothetical protein
VSTADVLMESVSAMMDGMVNFAIPNCAIHVAMPMGNAKMERVYVSPVGMANIAHSKVAQEGKIQLRELISLM